MTNHKEHKSKAFNSTYVCTFYTNIYKAADTGKNPKEEKIIPAWHLL